VCWRSSSFRTSRASRPKAPASSASTGVSRTRPRMRAAARSMRTSLAKHPQDPVNGQGGDEVLHRVAAHDLPERVDFPVQELGHLCKGEQRRRAEHVRTAAVSRREERDKEDDGHNRIGVSRQVRVQVLSPGELARAPIRHAADPDGQRRKEESGAGRDADAVGDRRGEERRRGAR
jgi:hypothetical protein